VELRGTEALLVQHSYGTTGVITEVEMPLAPARDWTELLISFADFPSAVRFGVTLGRSAGITKKLVSIYEWPIAHYMPAFRPLVPEGRTVVPCLVAAESREALGELAAEMGGTVETEAPEGQGPYGQPLYEFVFGHTMLQAKKSAPDLIEIEGFFRDTDLAALVTRVHRKLAGCGPMRLEIRLWAGDLVGSGSPFIRYRDGEQVAEIVRVLQEEGLKVANPHASSVRGVGKKEIGLRDIAFKRDIDPHGLLNPGRFEADSALDAKIDRHLPTDGWLASEPQATAELVPR
jgi:FAD/FMN-containing dehydrogenase